MPERPLDSQQQRNHERHHRALAQRMTSPFEVVPSLYDPATTPCIEPLPQDRRFVHERRQTFPSNWPYQSLLLQQQWWDNATTAIRARPNSMKRR